MYRLYHASWGNLYILGPDTSGLSAVVFLENTWVSRKLYQTDIIESPHFTYIGTTDSIESAKHDYPEYFL